MAHKNKMKRSTKRMLMIGGLALIILLIILNYKSGEKESKEKNYVNQ